MSTRARAAGAPSLAPAPAAPTRGHTTIRKLVYVAAVVVAIDAAAACTPRQLHDFIAWHERDPAAATAFSRLPAIQTLLHDPVPTQAAPPSRPSHTRDGGVWDRIAWCESGGNWSMHVHNRTGTYGGGLAIRDDVWRHYGGGEFAPHAGLASRLQQIVIAERIRADVGLDAAWQCWP